MIYTIIFVMIVFLKVITNTLQAYSYAMDNVYLSLPSTY